MQQELEKEAALHMTLRYACWQAAHRGLSAHSRYPWVTQRQVSHRWLVRSIPHCPHLAPVQCDSLTTALVGKPEISPSHPEQRQGELTARLTAPITLDRGRKRADRPPRLPGFRDRSGSRLYNFKQPPGSLLPPTGSESRAGCSSRVLRREPWGLEAICYRALGTPQLQPQACGGRAAAGLARPGTPRSEP